MKTDNVYFTMLRIVDDITYVPDENAYTGIKTIIHSKPLKPVMVKTKIKKDGKLIVKDLHTKTKYMYEIPLSVGKVFININHLFSLREHIPVEMNMPKKKVLKLGQEFISFYNKEGKGNKEE